MEQLKKCPFCGGKASLRQEDEDPRWMPTRNDPDSGGCPPYYVKCDDCGASTEYRYEYPDAVELWNSRKSSELRCKDCEHFDTSYCNHFDIFCTEDDFCSDASRKEVEQNATD